MDNLNSIHHHNYDETFKTAAKILGPVGSVITAIAVAAIVVPGIAAGITFAAVPLAIAGGVMVIAAIALVAVRHLRPISEAAKKFDWDSILEWPETRKKSKEKLERLKQLLINSNVTSCKYKKILVHPYHNTISTLAVLTDDDECFGEYANGKLPYNTNEVLYLFVTVDQKTSDYFNDRVLGQRSDYPEVKKGYIPYNRWSDSQLSSATLKSLELL